MNKIYEDDLIMMSLSKNPVAIGHIFIEPKEEATDLQSISDILVEQLFFGASYAATALFELANAQGTNIILEENPLRINVVARSQDDSLDFLWTPSQTNPQELKSVAKQVKDKLDILQWKEKNPQDAPSQKEEEIIVSDSSDSSNFLFKSINRIP